VRLWQWRPASRAAVLGWWVATLAVSAVLAVLVAIVVGVIAYVASDPSDEMPGLGALVAATGALVVVGYLTVIAGAVLLARRYVPPQRRGSGWTATFIATLVVATGLLVLGLAQVNQLVLAVTVPAIALAVPALVVTRVPVVAPLPAPASPPPGPPAGSDVPQE